jgi:hypothetical protein
MSNPINPFQSKWTQAGALLALSFVVQAKAQTFTHTDSGWVKLWNGKDWSEKNIYSRVYGATAPMQNPPDTSAWKILYSGTDTAAIYVSTTATNKQGNIGTVKASYSHYRMRVEGKFDVLGQNSSGGDNAGITYHTDETAVRMSNNWPRSIEFQMRQIETGAAFSIQYVTFDTKVSGTTYSPTGTAVKACESGCDRRNYNGSPIISNGSGGKTRWLRYELVARGSDSALHVVNDTVVFRLSNIRIYNDQTTNKTPNGPWDHGGIGLQSEGAMVKYRHWEIMEFPAATPKGENYLHRFLLDNPSKNSAAGIPSGSNYTVKWRTLGTIPNVNIDYGIGASGAWQPVVANLANTGTYDWAVPASISGQIRVRISGPAWAGADSNSGPSTTTIGNRLPQSKAFLAPVSFSIEGQGEVVSHVEAYSRLEVWDVFGHKIRSLRIQGENLSWNRKDDKGIRVRQGIYFVRLLGNGAEETVRTLIF